MKITDKLTKQITETKYLIVENSWRYLRKQYADRIDDNILTEDTLFKSPSAAAGFVTYGSANGLIMWATDEGRTLKDIENTEF